MATQSKAAGALRTGSAYVPSTRIALVQAACVSILFFMALYVALAIVRSGPTSDERWTTIKEVSDALGSLFTALCGVAAIYFSYSTTQLLTNKAKLESQRRTIFELHAEWASESMTKERNAGSAFIAKQGCSRPTARVRKITQLYKIDPHAVADLYRICWFFERVEYAIRKEAVQSDDALEIFGRVFVWWYRNALRAWKMHGGVDDSAITSLFERCREHPKFWAWMKNVRTIGPGSYPPAGAAGAGAAAAGVQTGQGCPHVQVTVSCPHCAKA